MWGESEEGGAGGEVEAWGETYRVVILINTRHGLEHLYCVLVEHVHPEPSQILHMQHQMVVPLQSCQPNSMSHDSAKRI